jgi:soluble lytic murein transglycosylase-like protein
MKVKKLKNRNKYVFYVSHKRLKQLKIATLVAVATVAFGLLFLGLQIGLKEQDMEIKSPLPDLNEVEEFKKESQTDAKEGKTIYDYVEIYSNLYGVDEDLALCVLARESNGRSEAVGDNGKAVGPWQFHVRTWESFRKEMGENTVDLRTDPFESTRTAIWAFYNGYGFHWTPFSDCLELANAH